MKYIGKFDVLNSSVSCLYLLWYMSKIVVETIIVCVSKATPWKSISLFVNDLIVLFIWDLPMLLQTWYQWILQYWPLEPHREISPCYREIYSRYTSTCLLIVEQVASSPFFNTFKIIRTKIGNSPSPQGITKLIVIWTLSLYYIILISYC